MLVVGLELAKAVEQQPGGLDVNGVAPLPSVDRQHRGGRDFSYRTFDTSGRYALGLATQSR